MIRIKPYCATAYQPVFKNVALRYRIYCLRSRLNLISKSVVLNFLHSEYWKLSCHTSPKIKSSQMISHEMLIILRKKMCLDCNVVFSR